MTNELDFGLAQRIGRARRSLLRVTDDCVDSVGNDVACGAAQCRRQDLRDMLSDRDGRRLETAWVWSIAAVSPAEMRAAVAAALVEPIGFGIAPIRPLTDAERLARLEYRVATELGEQGKRIVEENKR